MNQPAEQEPIMIDKDTGLPIDMYYKKDVQL
jgi:hypothetical protein